MLQLSSYSQIDTIICFIKCHVNVPSESPCYLLSPSAAFNKFSSYDLVLHGTTSSDSFLCTLEGKRSPKSFNSRFQQSEWNKQNHSLGRTNKSDKEMRKHLFSCTSPLLVVPFLSPTDPEWIKRIPNCQLGWAQVCFYVCVREEMAHLADPELATCSVCHSADINRHMQPHSHMQRWHTLRVATSTPSQIEHLCFCLYISVFSHCWTLTSQQ